MLRVRLLEDVENISGSAWIKSIVVRAGGIEGMTHPRPVQRRNLSAAVREQSLCGMPWYFSFLAHSIDRACPSQLLRWLWCRDRL